MKVYVVHMEDIYYDSDYHTMGIFSTRKKALKFFEEEKELARVFKEEKEQDIEEETTNNFFLYKTGCFNKNHCMITLEERVVQ